MKKCDESLSDYRKSIEIWDKIRNEGKVVDENEYAKAIGNISVTSSKVVLEKNKESLSNAGAKIYNQKSASALLNYRKKQNNGGNK